MNEEHENYRPKSPDLSALQPPPPPKLSRIPSYPDPPFPVGYSFSPRGSYDASPFFSPQTTTPSTSYFGSRTQSSATPHQYSPPAPPAPPPFRSQPIPTLSQPPAPLYHNPPPQPQNFYPTQPHYPPSFELGHVHQEPANHHYPFQPTALHQPYEEMPRTRQQRAEEQQFDLAYDPRAPPRQAMPVKAEQYPPASAMPAAPSDPSHGIDVKTKFPVARIKRIMQADEDVGKVAQATPTAVAKALELFMIALVSKGAEEAKANRSKRVTAQHLKAALMKDGQYDFLTDICENVPDEGSKKGRAKSEAKSEDSEDDIASKKKGKGGRKRKADSSDDSD